MLFTCIQLYQAAGETEISATLPVNLPYYPCRDPLTSRLSLIRSGVGCEIYSFHWKTRCLKVGPCRRCQWCKRLLNSKRLTFQQPCLSESHRSVIECPQERRANEEENIPRNPTCQTSKSTRNSTGNQSRIQTNSGDRWGELF